MPKPRIMFFSTLMVPPFWEGCEKFWYDFVRNENVRRDVDCHVVLARSNVTRERGRELQNVGVRVSYYTHFATSFFRRNTYRVGAKLGLSELGSVPWYSLIQKDRPSLVWFTVAGLQDVADLRFACKVCNDASVPYVIVIQHASEHFFCEDPTQAEAFSFVLRHARDVIYVSERNLRSIERAAGTRIENKFRTRNGLDSGFLAKAEQIANLSPVSVSGRARFLLLARYSLIAKGQHILFETLSDPIWRGRDWELSMVGGGDDFLVRRLVDYYSLDKDRIKLQGKTSDVGAILGGSDLLVIPSLSEGSPFALVEAMACGRPAVGTPVGGIPELIIDGQTGWLAESTEVRHFAEALNRAWLARESWVRIGSNARNQVLGDYKQESIAAELLDRIKTRCS